MLLDAHGGAVAAGGHGLWSSALRAALAVVRVVWRCAPLAVRAREVMGLFCTRRPGASAVVLCSAPGRLQHCGVSEALFLWVYGAAAALVDALRS